MKTRLFVVALTIMGAASMSYGEEVDLKYKMAREYMVREHVSVTVKARGTDLDSAGNFKKPLKADMSSTFGQEAILVVGEGAPKKGSTGGQRRLTAIRAAEVVAQRALAEMLKGVSIVGETMVRDAELESDVIKSSVGTFIKGFVPVLKEWNAREETAIVILKVGMTGPKSFGALMYENMLKEPKIQKVLDVPVFVPPADVAPPMPSSQPYDGLIIDATAYAFRPALINRIFNPNGEVLYDPAKISQKVLVEQGCGEYTNTVDKARAALGKRGVRNPLIVRASGTVSASDLQVSKDVSLQIFTANQGTGFMADARVAFVLK